MSRQQTRKNISKYEMDIKKKIQNMIEQTGMSEKAFAATCGFKQNNLNKIFLNYQHMNLTHLGKIMPKLGNDYCRIFMGEEQYIPASSAIDYATEQIQKRIGDPKTTEIIKEMIMAMVASVELRSIILSHYIEKRGLFMRNAKGGKNYV